MNPATDWSSARLPREMRANWHADHPDAFAEQEEGARLGDG